MAFSLSANHISTILLDIEGTTTPIAFVYEVLFPFARAGVRKYLENHIDEADVRQDLSRLREEHETDVRQRLDTPALLAGSIDTEIDSLVIYVEWLMDRDRKSRALKALQGKIWEEGYAAGKLKSQVFSDVPRSFERWREAGLNLSIFSSGSTLAQKLLFAHTDVGDLTEFLAQYFDTTTGPKAEEASYRRIASALQRSVSETLFISDVITELDAARAAGMKTVLCLRPGNHPQTLAHTHPTIRTFAEIDRE